MALDGITIAAIKTELKNKLIGGRIDKIYQPKDNLLTIRIRQPGENIKLLISANPQNPRIYITEQDFDNPYKPPAFCMLLRKHLHSGRIKEIKQPDFERILEIVIQFKNNEGTLIDKKLVVELMGRHSNIILTKPDKQILDCIKRVTKKISRYRELLPGKEYSPPPEQGKVNPLTTNSEEFKELLTTKLEEPMYKAIMDNYRGIGPTMGQEITCRAGFATDQQLTNPQEINNLWPAFNNLFTRVQNNEFNHTLVLDTDDNFKEYKPFDLQQFQLPTESFSSINKLLDYYFTNRITRRKISKLTKKMTKVVTDNLNKAEKKYRRVKGQLKGAKNADKHQLKGELITANIYRLEQGHKKVTLENYYDENNQEITIELDPELTPAENAQRYFDKYEKAKSSVKYLKREVKKTDIELDYLKQVKHNIEQAESLAELRKIEEELIEGGYIKQQTGNNDDKQDKKLPPLKFTSSDDYQILVGRNNKQNDKLTHRIANNQDTWVHVKDLPGSHVIIRNHTGKEIPEETLFEAAHIAAFYSKGRKSSNVPVDYTQVKYVAKAPGGKPGLVYYKQESTLYATPDKELIEELKKE